MSKYAREYRDVSSKDIDGISDLVVWAPIKQGFIEAFSNVTYETRLRVVAEALHNVRKSAREHELIEPFSDTAKRILSLLDFRIGIVDRDLFQVQPGTEKNPEQSFRPRKYMYLVATFDGPWEPYMRLIWEPLGAFLDLVLCNCEGYVPSIDHDFETYAQWVRDNQLDSAIFYSTSGLTVKDKIYLSDIEEVQRSNSGPVGFETIAQHSIRHPDDVAKGIRDSQSGRLLAWKLGLEALNVLFKLADYYPGDDVEIGDGRYLLRAARRLLNDYDFPGLPGDLKRLYKPQLDWYRLGSVDHNRRVERDPEFDECEIQKGLLTSYDNEEFITSHGALLLIRVKDPELTKLFLEFFPFSWEGEPAKSALTNTFFGQIFTNVAFSYGGLEKLGVPERELRTFPKEFRQGMQERAALLGDKYGNHPRRWRLPVRNGPFASDYNDRPVELSEIDITIQVRSGFSAKEFITNTFQSFSNIARNLRTANGKEDGPRTFEEELARRFISEHNIQHSKVANLLNVDPFDQEIPLSFDWFNQVFAQRDGERSARPLIEMFILYVATLGEFFGFEVVCVEDMCRPDADQIAQRANDTAPNLSEAIDHFGFRDGISQPVLVDKVAKDAPPDHVTRGELFYGYKNMRGDTHRPEQRDDLKYRSSFLVVRKMRQDVKYFREFENAHSPKLIDALVGRKKGPAGTPLIGAANGLNDFTYESDPKAKMCPFSAHIRLSNPRGEDHGRKHPMILRRGMSFGGRYDEENEDHRSEVVPQRGIVFMAYCASIAEQYEVIQRWLNAGNPTGVSSAQNDPLTGAHPANGPQLFRCQIDGAVQQVQIEKPFVTLDWGHYFFVPSRTSLNKIASFKTDQDTDHERQLSGEEIITQIEQLPDNVQRDEWKRLLEDHLTKDPAEHDITPRVWEAIDARGGAIRIESGIAFDSGDEKPTHKKDSTQKVVLVTSQKHIMDVFKNECLTGGSGDSSSPVRPFSSREQYERISREGAFGTIYVSLDSPCPHLATTASQQSRYHNEAYPTNSFLMKHTLNDAIHDGFLAGQTVLNELKAVTEKLNPLPRSRALEFKLELGHQYIQRALANLCHTWFGIPDYKEIEAGSWDWRKSRSPVCPGDFLSPSRHAFYPRPTTTIEKYGLKHGSALRDAVRQYVKDHWDEPTLMKGKIASQMHDALRKQATGERPGAPDVDYKELMGRNLIGIMIGALPPMDANLRFAMLEWLNEETLWRLQSDFRQQKQSLGLVDAAKAALNDPLVRAMCLRPAPDLIYRVANEDFDFDGVTVRKDEMVILCLSAAMQALIRENKPSVELVFGGNRKDQSGTPLATGDHPQHACPAQDMAMGGMIGIIAALLDAGTIQAMPASLIVGVSDWT
ncbi:MAG: hypothetical protein AAFR51_17345 [Pseudomonadota bacterium]